MARRVRPIHPGEQYGRWTVMYKAHRPHYWECRCECGDSAAVYKYSLLDGISTSCGCWNAERATTHGLSRHPLYHIWLSMVRRCTAPGAISYPHYGARGISVCDEWRESFPSFLRDMGSRPSKDHSLERMDNDRGYEPGNVVWATRDVQGRNRSNSRWINDAGMRLTVTDAAARHGLPRHVVYARLNSGWPAERVLSQPVARRRAEP